ncbi:MAG: acyl-CoA dehydrogenase family protein, partial [Clostridium sp.]|nr:acyl-CoA dehydrogenase family protein [Clostridium sp.]
MYFTEQHELVRKLAREFAETELTKEILDEVEEKEVFPEEILDKMAKAGFFGIKVPKEYGGQGADARSYVIVMEEFARVSGVASIYVSSPNSLSGGPFLLSGTEEQKRKYLTP